jgi:hypothetical protein
MSTYQKNGARKVKLEKRKETKAHLKKFYSILDDMDVLAKQLEPQKDFINEDNVNEYAAPLYGRDLDSMESMIVLGKLKNGDLNDGK